MWIHIVISRGTAQSVRELATMPCPNMCSTQGWCDTSDRRCNCYDGFAGADCSWHKCPTGPAWADEPDAIVATDMGHVEAECSRRGYCDYTSGTCNCDEGYEGAACERKACYLGCSGQGKCVSMQYYATLKDPGYGTSFTYGNVWDAKMLYGCACDEGFAGNDCSQRECPSGDDPGTTGVTEVQSLVCTADSGTLTLGFGNNAWTHEVWTTSLSYRASTSDVEAALDELSTILTPGGAPGVSVTFSGQASILCDDAGDTTAYIEFLQNYGDLPLLQVSTSGLTLSTGTATATIARTRKATKEDVACSNRGICDHASGTCDCSITSTCSDECFTTSNGFGGTGARGDCGAFIGIVQSCPGEIECSNRGVCDPSTHSCQCQAGYAGADCSLMTCPYGKSWFSFPTANDQAHDTSAECSDAGICNRDTGDCQCDPSFEGAACQDLKCPGDGVCSGHGECLSMALLAQASTVNGVSSPQTYGASPNDALRWDWDSVKGCRCNDAWVGHDCALQACPYGDDPLSKHQLNEIQLVNCDLESSADLTITFTFREESVSIDAKTTTLADLEASLESLDTIDDVKLYFDIAVDDDAGLVCSTAGTDVYVEFLRPTGDVPLITADRNSVISVGEYTKGTKEWEECSGRGLCTRTDGTCACFTGYGSSDGQGGPGPYADCGNVLPVIAELLDSA